jgi:hypothetical protein
MGNASASRIGGPEGGLGGLAASGGSPPTRRDCDGGCGAGGAAAAPPAVAAAGIMGPGAAWLPGCGSSWYESTHISKDALSPSGKCTLCRLQGSSRDREKNAFEHTSARVAQHTIHQHQHGTAASSHTTRHHRLETTCKQKDAHPWP